MRNDQNRYYQSQDISKKKHIITGVVIGSLMFIFLVFLFNLQVVNYFEYERKAREVSLRSEIIPAQRGKIYDRNKDRPLAVNIDSFAISLIPAEVENDQMDALLRSLSDL